ncbi:J domain-containing protein [Mycena kentingensis (nom. inval.)]|nr:J domain-containing protein [Mycena kentingensis (nom. inval.)]
MEDQKHRLYAVLNVSNYATDAEIHARFRALSLLFHPDKHMQSSEEEKRVALARFLEVQRAYEVLSDPFLRKVYDSLGPQALTAVWVEEDRTRSTDELQAIFDELRREWTQDQLARTLGPRGRVECGVDAAPLFLPYDGLEEDSYARRLMNRVGDVKVMRMSLSHEIEKSITKRLSASLAARVSRGRGSKRNFTGTLRHQFSPRLSFKATSTLLFPYEIGLTAKYRVGSGSASVQTSFRPHRTLLPQRTQVELSQRLSRRPGAFNGNLKVKLSRNPEVSINVSSQDLEEPVSGKDHYLTLLPRDDIVRATSYGLVLDSFPKLFGECGFRFPRLSMQCKLALECGITRDARAKGLAWVLTGAWSSPTASLAAVVRLSYYGLYFEIDASYMKQSILLPILLAEHRDTSLALWATALPSVAFFAIYRHKVRKLERQRRRDIRKALKALKPDSSVRRETEAVVSCLRDKARDCSASEAARAGLVILDASYGVLNTAERNLGLVWDVTIPLQALVRESQIYVSGRHPKSSIQGFLDPAPFAVKSLCVRYLFRGRTHYIELPEYISLVLPLAEHIVGDS